MNKKTRNIIIIVGALVVFAIAFKKQIVSFFTQVNLDVKQVRLVAGFHPFQQWRFIKLARQAKKLGWTVYWTSTYRPIIPDKRSFHGFGLAGDLNLFRGLEHVKKKDDVQTWLNTGVPQLAQELGFRWGAYFQNNYDPVHFDLATIYSMDNLTAISHDIWGDNYSAMRGNRMPLPLFQSQAA